MEYRREIDGLRALAVVPVILFHAGFRAFSGGFVGVDVFFVISGYLITSLILAEKAQGTFSLAGFYERRARRILPALFVVMAVCIPVAWFCLLPGAMKAFSESLVAVSVFASNALFYRETGYFAPDAELKPLLHTWSLAVEEQFYVLYPLLLLAAWRLGRKWIVPSLVTIAILSLALAQWGAFYYPAATFFLLPTRAWELSLGALIAFYGTSQHWMASNERLNPTVKEVASAVGVVTILAGVFVFNKNTPFPSLYALLPTLGTVLVILFAFPQTATGKLLGNKAFVGLGLISYSAYLWHQPLFAFARHISLDEPGRMLLLTLTLAAILLAYLSWRFVETPFRNRRRFSRKQIGMYAVLGSLAFVVFGVLGSLSNGFEGRYTNEENAILAYTNYDFSGIYGMRTCLLEPEQGNAEFLRQCAPSRAPGGVLIWGDSYAAAISHGLRPIVRDLAQYTSSGCPPLVGIQVQGRFQCQEINDFVKEEIRQLQPATMILHAHWRRYREIDLPPAIDRTLEFVRRVSPNTRIVLVGVVPQWNPALPVYMVKKHIGLTAEKYAENAYLRNGRAMDKALKAVADRNGIAFFSVIDALCAGDKCLVTTTWDGKPTLTIWDNGHLTAGGSKLVASKLAQEMR